MESLRHPPARFHPGVCNSVGSEVGGVNAYSVMAITDDDANVSDAGVESMAGDVARAVDGVIGNGASIVNPVNPGYNRFLPGDK